jgi:hypothetical protein
MLIKLAQYVRDGKYVSFHARTEQGFRIQSTPGMRSS